MTISALSVEQTEAWKAELYWWSSLSRNDITIFPAFDRRLALTYLVSFQGDGRQVMTKSAGMREAIAKRAVTHLLRTGIPRLSQSMRPGALRRLRSTLQQRMERDLTSTLDQLEQFVRQRIGLFPGEENGRGYGLWLLEQILRNCPSVGERELIALARNAHVSEVMHQ